MPTYQRGGASTTGGLPDEVLDALGDGTRRRIVQCLRVRPASVADLAAQLPVSRPAISQHLRVLRDCRLVDFDEVGTRNIYRLEPAGLGELRAWLEGYWSGVLGAFATAAEDARAKGATNG